MPDDEEIKKGLEKLKEKIEKRDREKKQWGQLEERPEPQKEEPKKESKKD